MGLWEERRMTLVLVNLASIMERADEALLPAVYKEVGEAIHASLTGLGSLTFFRTAVQAACYPLAAYMATRHNRAHVIALGAFLWAAATFLVGISSTFLQVAISRGLNGIGLALVIPAIQSLVADSTVDETRGSAFGWLQFTGTFGSIFGGLLSISLASKTIMGIAGWRIAFYLVALVSMVVGFLVWHFAVDPHFASGTVMTNKRGTGTHRSVSEVAKDLIKEAKSVMHVPSFQIIVAQGVTGSFPWATLAFLPMWFELIGFSHEYTGFLMSLFFVATLIGGLFGGMMGDFLARRFPNGGRIILSQISSGSAIPLAAVLLLALPGDPSTGFSHALAIFVTGFLFSWNGAATNNPIFAEIVPEESRTSIYALDRSFESVLGSFALPVVGILAERVYGYKIGFNDKSDDPTTNRENAASLAKALYTVIAIPMLLSCSIYSFLYCTYPRDRERARMHSLIASEIDEQIEPESSDIERNDPQLQNIQLVVGNEMRIINSAYEEPERDTSTEKLLPKKL